jgi:two-component system, chemotaxis family, CheB/CheR fusion protein
LLKRLHINFTSFFRDSSEWNHLAGEILPRILTIKAVDDPIRILSLGCASGEEAFSMAILLAEALGKEKFHRRVRIYGLDIDQQAIGKARRGVYPLTILKAVSPERLRAYFDVRGDGYGVTDDLRRSVIFGRYDLIADAPFSHMDLILCRNTLIYFDRRLQRRIYARLHYALNPSGYLFMGRTERADIGNGLFTRVSPGFQIYSKNARNALRVVDMKADVARNHDNRLLNAVLQAGERPQIILTSGGKLASANAAACAFFMIQTEDIRQPFGDWESSHRPRDLIGSGRADVCQERSGFEGTAEMGKTS